MTEVTDADRERAWAALRQANENDGYTLSDDEARVEAIAAALAEEREKARAPFLSLLTLCDAVGKSVHPHAKAYAAVAHDIRRAAEETE